MTEIIQFIKSHASLVALIAPLCTSVVFYFFMKEMYQISSNKTFTVQPSSRRKHNGHVPFLGGIAIYLSCLIPIGLFAAIFKDAFDLSLLAIVFFGTTILAFVGIYDDLQNISPRKKLLAELFVAVTVLLLVGFFEINFNNLFGLYELSKVGGFALSTFLIISFINAFNFIDGIDGLCSGIALIAFAFFGILAIYHHDNILIFLNFSIVGALIPYLYFNIFSKKKIFLGDSGSFILGFILGFQVVIVLSGYFEYTLNIGTSIPVIIMAIFSYPLIDSARVILIRMAAGNSPLKGDRNHIHHHLVDLGLTHGKATLVVLVYTVLITCTAIFLRDVNINIIFVVLFILAAVILNIPLFLLKRKRKASLPNRPPA